MFIFHLLLWSMTLILRFICRKLLWVFLDFSSIREAPNMSREAARHTWTNGSHMEKWIPLLKNGSHLEYWVRLKKICHTWRNGSLLQKWVTIGKTGYTFKKWVTLGIMGNTFEKCVTLEIMSQLEKMSHTWKNTYRSHLKRWAPLEYWVTLEEMGPPWKNGSHLLKNGSSLKNWVTLGKIGYTRKIRSLLVTLDLTNSKRD